ncbi:MAG: hypothetical protein ACFFEF_06180 [Candidatus Thorarchaeota archaeon]
MSEDTHSRPPEPQKQEAADDHRRPFNPMRTYVEFAVGIFITYAAYYLLGIEFLLITTLAFLVLIFRDTRFILDYYSYGFARKASVFNAIHATAWFAVLAINVFYIIQFGVPLILPELDSLTTTAPLFVLMAAFGSKNIIKMYSPSDDLVRKRKSSELGL